MLSLGPAARSRVGFPGHSLALALASALLALSLGLLIATVTGPQGEGAQAIDGWHRLMSGDLRALLVFSLPCAAWLVAVAAYIRSSPARAATPVGPQVPAQDETATSPSTHLHDNMESEIPVQVRRSFRDALREDGVGLALSRPAGRQIGTAHAHKEDDEMLRRQMAAIALTTAGAISACDSMESPQRSVSKAAVEPSVGQQQASQPDPSASAPKGDGINVAGAAAKVLFHCATENGKEIVLIDRGTVIEYSFGRPRQAPELAISVPRDEVTTYQWGGVGRWMNYSVTIPNGSAKYTVFTSADRIGSDHEFEAGVVVKDGQKEVARIRCVAPIVSNLAGVNLRVESHASSAMEDAAGYRASYGRCIEDSNGATFAMLDCISDEFEHQDRRLNKAYQALTARLGKDDKSRFLGEQRQWISARDERCFYDPESGQAGRLDAAECALEMTATRAAEIELR